MTKEHFSSPIKLVGHKQKYSRESSVDLYKKKCIIIIVGHSLDYLSLP